MNNSWINKNHKYPPFLYTKTPKIPPNKNNFIEIYYIHIFESSFYEQGFYLSPVLFKIAFCNPIGKSFP